MTKAEIEELVIKWLESDQSSTDHFEGSSITNDFINLAVHMYKEFLFENQIRKPEDHD